MRRFAHALLIIFAFSLTLSAAAQEPPMFQLTFGEWDSSPAWSPDGTQIAFHSNRSGSNVASIWVLWVPAVPVEPATWGAIKAHYR